MDVHDFDSLKANLGHRIVCVGYGEAGVEANVAIECETCVSVPLDFDADEVADDAQQ